MLQSHVIEISGIFAGTAVRMPGAYRFIAVDPRVTALHHREWPSLDALRRGVTAGYLGMPLSPGQPFLHPARSEPHPRG